MAGNKSIQEIQPKQAKRGIPMQIKAGGAVLGLGIAALFNTACPQEPPKECNCPNGTVHPEGTSMPCCDGEGCNCAVIHNLNYAKSFIVEDRTRGGFTPYIKNLMQLSLTTYCEGGFFYTEDRDLKLIIVRDNSKNSIERYENTNNTMITSIEYLSSLSTIEEFAEDLGGIFSTLNTAAKLNNRNSDIRLAKTKPVITPRRLAAFEKTNKTRNMMVSGNG